MHILVSEPVRTKSFNIASIWLGGAFASHKNKKADEKESGTPPESDEGLITCLGAERNRLPPAHFKALDLHVD